MASIWTIKADEKPLRLYVKGILPRSECSWRRRQQHPSPVEHEAIFTFSKFTSLHCHLLSISIDSDTCCLLFCILYPELSISLLASSTVVGIRKLAQLVFYDHLPSIPVTCYLVRRLMNFPRKKTIFKAQKSRFRRLNMQSETPLVFYEDLRVHYFKRTNAF